MEPQDDFDRISDYGAGRPSRGSRLWLWLIGCVLVAGAGGAIGFWVFLNVAVRLLLTDQPMRVQLPPQMTVTAQTQQNLDVRMKGVINAVVPLKQVLDFPINGTYDTEVNIDTWVLLETTIRYRGVVPIDTFADITANVPLNYQNVKKYKNLQLKAKLPMKLRVPMSLTVPVKQRVHVVYRGPMRATIHHTLKVPVDTVMNTRLNVNQDFSLPVTSRFGLSMQIPPAPVGATIHSADLYLPLHTLRMEDKGDAQ